MNKRTPYSQLMMASVAFSLLCFSLLTANTLPGYSHTPYQFDLITEAREISRTEGQKYKSGYFKLGQFPVEELTELQINVSQPFQGTIDGEIWHQHLTTRQSVALFQLQKNFLQHRLIEKRLASLNAVLKKQKRSWHLIALTAIKLPAITTLKSSSEHRLGGWKESNAMYHALNSHPSPKLSMTTLRDKRPTPHFKLSPINSDYV